MNHRPDVGVGASFVLSVLVVAVAAVALHPVSQAPATKTASAAAPAPKSQKKVEPPAVARGPRVTPSAPRSQEEPALAQAPRAPASRQPAVIRTSRHQPDSSFTYAGHGETLADVAARVYGSPEASKSLWRANRDRLESPDVPLVAGMMLRTP